MAPHPLPAGQGAAGPAALASVSLFELPVSRGARWARILAVLALNAVLAGAGIAMIVSYLHARERAQTAPPTASDPGMAEVEVLAPVPAKAPPDPSAKDRTGAPGQQDQQAPGTTGERSAPARDPRTPGASRSRSPHAEHQEQPARSGMAAGVAPDQAPSNAAAPGDHTAAVPASNHDTQRITREVALIVNRHTEQLQRCYHQAARAAASDPDNPIAGRLAIHVEIAVSGRATNVHPVENTTGSEPLARCVTTLFESWTYPRPPGNESLELVWPIQFKAPK
jgi:hypothetical protein